MCWMNKGGKGQGSKNFGRGRGGEGRDLDEILEKTLKHRRFSFAKFGAWLFFQI